MGGIGSRGEGGEGRMITSRGKVAAGPPGVAPSPVPFLPHSISPNAKLFWPNSFVKINLLLLLPT